MSILPTSTVKLTNGATDERKQMKYTRVPVRQTMQLDFITKQHNKGINVTTHPNVIVTVFELTKCFHLNIEDLFT